MFDSVAVESRPGGLPTEILSAWVDTVAGLAAAVDDAERVDQIALLERLKSAAAAAQAQVTADFAASQRRALESHGVPRAQQARPIAAQVALARRDNSFRGNRHLGMAEALVHEMPATLAALQRGDVSEWRATLMVRETACLSREDRRAVDAELADRLPTLGDKQVADEARRIAYRLDPAAVMRRVRGAESDRRVSLRPAPDAMSLLTGFVPAAQGVAAHVALCQHADAVKAAGDDRSRGQIMADELVARLTGQTGRPATPTPDPCSWDTPYPAPVPEPDARTDMAPPVVNLDISLVMTDGALFCGEDTPATLVGYGPIPAALARRLVREADEQASVWLRRLYTDPVTGALVAMESHRRRFEHGLRRFLVLRDGLCRTPWCNAPIRHTDHLNPAHDGGATSADNGQGLCESCNYVKQSLGWTARPGPDGAVVTTTPTGHRYPSPVPPLPGPRASFVPGPPGVTYILRNAS